MHGEALMATLQSTAASREVGSVPIFPSERCRSVRTEHFVILGGTVPLSPGTQSTALISFFQSGTLFHSFQIILV